MPQNFLACDREQPLRDGQLDECFHVEKLWPAPLTR
jgi:hypothetical protein